MNFKNLAIRSLSGIVYVGAIIGCILWGKVGMGLLCSLFAIGASYELEKQTLGKAEGSRWMLTWVLDAAILVAMVWCSAMYLSFWGMPLFFAGIILFLFRFIWQIFIVQPKPLMSVAVSCLAILYIGFPLALFASLSWILNLPWVLICAVAMIWINDSGAYLVGCTIGRNKMFPRLSPKKSWEGFIGGVVFNIAAAFIYFYCFDLKSSPFLSNVQGWIFIGIAVSAIATLGDLFESMLKRSLGIKDFGNIIPGHGGILDRIDSLLFVVPGVSVFCFLGYLMFL